MASARAVEIVFFTFFGRMQRRAMRARQKSNMYFVVFELRRSKNVGRK